MADWPGLDRVFAIVDERFGRRFGTGFLLVVVLAIIAFCLDGIWKWIVRPIYNTLTGFLAQPVFVTPDDFAPTLITIFIVFILILLAFVMTQLLRNFFRRKIPQAIIDALAVLRSEGISILNDKPSALGGLDKWEAKWNEWRGRVVEELDENLTQAESLSFQRLGVLEPTGFAIAENPAHNHKLMMLSKQITILQNLIDRHQERH